MDEIDCLQAAPSERPVPDPITVEKVYGIFVALKNRQKIHAIKAVRELTNIGLREAKDLVDSLTPLWGETADDVRKELRDELSRITRDHESHIRDLQKDADVLRDALNASRKASKSYRTIVRDLLGEIEELEAGRF